MEQEMEQRSQRKRVAVTVETEAKEIYLPLAPRLRYKHRVQYRTKSSGADWEEEKGEKALLESL